MATIITKNSQTASAVPAASSLEVGELAVNTADGKLYTEHTGGVVKQVGGNTQTISAGTGISVTNPSSTNPTITNTGVTSVAAGTGISVSASTGGVTISASGGGVTSLNGQTGAITTTTFGNIGSVVYGLNVSTSNYKPGDTISGSNLYYVTTVTQYGGSTVWSEGSSNYNRPYTQNFYAGQTTRETNGNSGYGAPAGCTALSGTWRCLQWCSARTSTYNSKPNATYSATYGCFWVRVS
jgi:hypothetical protein